MLRFVPAMAGRRPSKRCHGVRKRAGLVAGLKPDEKGTRLSELKIRPFAGTELLETILNQRVQCELKISDRRKRTQLSISAYD
jgi:hypothetical protein